MLCFNMVTSWFTDDTNISAWDYAAKSVKMLKKTLINHELNKNLFVLHVRSNYISLVNTSLYIYNLPLVFTRRNIFRSFTETNKFISSTYFTNEHQLLYFYSWLYHSWKYCIWRSLGEIFFDHWNRNILSFT